MKRNRWLLHYFWIDPRTLAAFRIFMGCTLIEEWIRRWIERDAFIYTTGILNPAHWNAPFSIFNVIPPGFATDLFLIVGLLALIAFTLGWFTRWSQWAVLIFQLESYLRTDAANNAGDVVSSCLLFWTAFLPLGETWSLDRFCKTSHRAA